MKDPLMSYTACSVLTVVFVITAAGAENPKAGAKLQPGMEQRLRWGKPVNGLRAALVIRPSSDEPKADDVSDLYLVVQNVSDSPVRFTDTAAAPKLRELFIKLDGRIQAGILSKEPTLVSVLLQPRDAVLLLMFPPDSKGSDRRTPGSVIAEAALKDPDQTLVGELNIEQAKAGTWAGKLITGETSAAEAAGKAKSSGR